MYCVSIGFEDFEKALKTISEFEMAEIRLDLCNFDRKQVKKIFSYHHNLIATFRKTEKVRINYREEILKTAVIHGAKWLDLDMTDNSKMFIIKMKEFCLQHNCKLILSVHDYEKTPGLGEIEGYIQYAEQFKPDLIKAVFYSNSPGDNAKVMSLYKKYKNIIAFNMGETGKITRIESLNAGAPWIYVASGEGSTAPGQLTIAEIKKYPKPK